MSAPCIKVRHSMVYYFPIMQPHRFITKVGDKFSEGNIFIDGCYAIFGKHEGCFAKLFSVSMIILLQRLVTTVIQVRKLRGRVADRDILIFMEINFPLASLDEGLNFSLAEQSSK